MSTIVFVLLRPIPAAAQSLDAPARLRTTVLGTKFMVDPTFDRAIAERVDCVRALLAKQRHDGKFIAYISIPLTPKGGGHLGTNRAISEHVKKRVEDRFGKGRLFVLAPGLVESQLATVEGRSAGGGEYMYMWTQILAGEDGSGRDFDMVYFVGPTDIHEFFGIGDTPILDALDKYIEKQAKIDMSFRMDVAENPAGRRAFLRYYGLRASVSYSSGAHDEWNIFRLVNRNRDTGDQVAIWFDGRAVGPGPAEASVSAGYERSAP